MVGANTEELVEYEARTMSSTWTISLDQVRSQDGDAAELLAFLAYLNNRDIWYDLLKPQSGRAWPCTLNMSRHGEQGTISVNNVEITGLQSGKRGDRLVPDSPMFARLADRGSNYTAEVLSFHHCLIMVKIAKIVNRLKCRGVIESPCILFPCQCSVIHLLCRVKRPPFTI